MPPSMCMFQPALRSPAEGTQERRVTRIDPNVSTSPPPRRRRGRSDRVAGGKRWRFQPALRLVGEGDEDRRDRRDVRQEVSTRPPPRRRRGRHRRSEGDDDIAVSTRPPPRRRRGRGRRARAVCPESFNPPPASSAEGTWAPRGCPLPSSVSTRPPPRRRRGPRHRRPLLVVRLVSTRPPPRRRRGQWLCDLARRCKVFQPALRLVGGGDQRGSPRCTNRPRFNPPSASSAEGTRRLTVASTR